MSNSDYQVALLLQKQCEQENNKFVDADHTLALLLQEQLNNDKKLQNGSPHTNSQKKNTTANTKSLIDPSWELVDPTPNIHTLFVTFNEHFFWTKLLAVCVSWSKRMTSCAGICSYNGRGGMCTITLSEPLLKLRPRKDLVETLLHEMIHAYLFVTHNNKDRDGHGPEFHKHMDRINNEAGTSISVYHSFHDEVKLYQTHWWRCDGPCKSRKPYFGIVRRATNRAPSHNDRWWGEHSRSCGGNFIKVKEPEKVEKPKKTGKDNVKPVNKNTSDIRNFLPNNNTINLTSTKETILINDSDKPISSLISTSKRLNNNSNNNNIRTIYSDTTSTITKAGETFRNNSVTSNIKTINSKSSTITKIPEKATNSINSKPSTITRIPETATNSKQDYANVRDHWLNKFPDKSTLNKAKRISEPVVEATFKKMKIDDEEGIDIIVKCPVCDLVLAENLLNEHLDVCLISDDQFDNIDKSLKNDTPFKFVPPAEVRNSQSDGALGEANISLDQTQSINDFFDTCDVFDKIANVDTKTKIETETPKTKKEMMVDCPSCDTKIIEGELNMHLDVCLKNKSVNKNIEMCFICDKNVPKHIFESHVTQCLENSNFESTQECDICNERFSEMHILNHIKSCIQNISCVS